jgi:hypothetical protein
MTSHLFQLLYNAYFSLDFTVYINIKYHNYNYTYNINYMLNYTNIHNYKKFNISDYSFQ